MRAKLAIVLGALQIRPLQGTQFFHTNLPISSREPEDVTSESNGTPFSSKPDGKCPRTTSAIFPSFKIPLSL